jgi:hypothetical protein
MLLLSLLFINNMIGLNIYFLLLYLTFISRKQFNKIIFFKIKNLLCLIFF